MSVKSRIYIAAGFACVALGLIGIPMPLLPTTPFLLLATFFFARGSERWYNWLMTHPTLSPYILAFRDKRGLTRAQKWRIAALVSLTLVITGAFAPLYGKALAAFIWVTSLLFLYFTPTAETN
ncbi:MAG: Inner membrane protein YbaN [Acidobacteria bacterium]|nr:Inner membrane protein YbaN [Acidobacteriota bacterium]